LNSLTFISLGNAVSELGTYRLDLLLILPKLKKLDGVVVSDEERAQAIKLKHEREAVPIEATE